ncbi:hypothetical protein KNE206_05900 [Kitasatospora sp. NE20-6]|uniref:hypothetical protein n=1 Tax=Kitasatospora sp. NE20-6 TaxID=2859066 RepID=UPI0034DC8BFC
MTDDRQPPPAPEPPDAPGPGPAREPLRAPWPSGAGALHPLTMDLGSYSSTLALFTNRRLTGRPVDPAQESVLLAGLAALLTDPVLGTAGPAIVERTWELLENRLQERLPDPPAGPAALAALLDPATGTGVPGTGLADADGLTALRQAVTLAVEEAVEQRDDLALRIHRIHDDAYAEDALRSLRMLLLAVNQTWDRPEIRSLLAVDPKDVRKSVLVDRAGAVSGPETGGRLLVPGLKRWLLRPQPFPGLSGAALPAGWGADTDTLVGQAYHDLQRRAERSLLKAVERGTATEEEKALTGLPVEQTVVTYPVSTPPTARTRLQHLVRDALGLRSANDVDIRFDEATAAALYFLLKGFGGDLEAGLAEFRSRAAPLPGAELPTWRQVMLVLDIGGGTTDIALLAVDLEDHTGREAPAEGDDHEGVRIAGRRYLLRPRVLGSTGHPQLGGDLITLRIFHWAKAALADALVAAARARQGTAAAKGLSAAVAAAAAEPWTDLAPQVLASRRPDPVPAHVRAALRTLLPTHTPRGGDPGDGPRPAQRSTREFEALWYLAEYTKQDRFAGEHDGAFGKLFAAELPTGCVWRKDVEVLPGSVALPAEGFEAIVRPVVDTAVRMAADLARQCLGRGYEDRIDLIALSGRTTGMPQVRRIIGRQLVRELSGRGDGLRPVAWDPAQLITAGPYAKQAAVLGASWARGTLDYREENDRHRSLGVDRLDMRVENLLLTLPSGFGLATNRGLPMPLLAAGTPIDRCDAAGRYFVRTGWQRLIPSVDLHRIMGRDRSMEWGRYRYLAHGSPDAAAPPDDVWFQIELDQELIPSLLLCRGDRHGVRPRLQPFHAEELAQHLIGGDLDSRPLELAAVPDLAGCFEHGRLVRVPRIGVRPAGEPGPAAEVFPASPARSALTYDFVTDGPNTAGRGFATPGGVEAAGAVSALPLPTVGPDHLLPDSYEFWADAGEGPVALGTLTVPLTADAPHTPVGPVPVWALLDGRGRLRLHRGFPAHLPARTLAEMERLPGHVLRTAMDPGITDWNDDWDPFTGDH